MEVIVGLLLGDLGDSLMLVQILAIPVNFFDEFLVSFDEVREELTVDSHDGYHESS
jgi:hypothetical protein